MTDARSGSAERGRSYWRFAAAFAAFALATPAVIFGSLDRFGVEEVEVGIDVVDALTAALPELARDAEVGGGWGVGFLGDSMVVSYPPGRTVPSRLEQAVEQLRGPRPRVKVVSLAAPGMGPFDYYFVANLVARAKPEQVILPFNLATLSVPWRGTFSRPELGGWLDPSQVTEALQLPLEWVGLTTDRLRKSVISTPSSR